MEKTLSCKTFKGGTLYPLTMKKVHKNRDLSLLKLYS